MEISTEKSIDGFNAFDEEAITAHDAFKTSNGWYEEESAGDEAHKANKKKNDTIWENRTSAPISREEELSAPVIVPDNPSLMHGSFQIPGTVHERVTQSIVNGNASSSNGNLPD